MAGVSHAPSASRIATASPRRAAVSRSTAELPTTSGAHSSRMAGRVTALATTSGPIPQGSPMVMATVGRSVKCSASLIAPIIPASPGLSRSVAVQRLDPGHQVVELYGCSSLPCLSHMRSVKEIDRDR